MSDVDWDAVLLAAVVLRDAAADIDHTMGTGSPGDVTLPETVRLMQAMGDTLGVLRHAYEYVHGIASQLMEDNDVDVPALGVHLHRDWRRNRTDWRHDDLLRDVLSAAQTHTAAHAVDPETGEAVHTFEQAVRALSKSYNLRGYNARVTALRDYGIDVGEYCAQGAWQPTIKIEPLDEGAPDDDD